MRRSSAALSIVVLVGLSSACEVPGRPASTLWTGPQEPGQRTLLEPSWEKVWELGQNDDPLLARPLFLAGGDSTLVWWDAYLHQIFSVDLTGRVRWTFGGKGEGPDELAGVAQLEVAEDGSVVALDSDNGRIVRLSARGERTSIIPLPEGYWRGLVLLPDGSMVLHALGSPEPFALVSAEGELLRRFAPPWAPFAELSALERQGRLLSGPGARWTYAFLVGNGWFPYTGIEPSGYVGQNIEHTDFPEVLRVRSGEGRVTKMARRPRCAICAGWIRGDTLNVLFGGGSEMANAVLDSYRWSDGRYVESLRLPRAASEAVATDDLVVLLTPSPLPRIAAFRPASRP